jgi:hypothetical protein
MAFLTGLLQSGRLLLVLLLPPALLAAFFAVIAAASRPVPDAQPTVKRVFLSCYAASIAAAIVAIWAFISYLSWACKHGQDQICHDGQVGMGLIIIIPLAWLVGSFIGWLWTWFTIRTESSRIFAAGYRYSGTSRNLNRAFNWIFPPTFWMLVGFILFELVT